MNIYDATLFSKKPENILMKEISVIYKGALEKEYYAGIKPNTKIIMDLEDKDDVNAYRKMKSLKDLFPKQEIGNYKAYPQRDFWRSIEKESSIDYQEWRKENSLRAPMANEMDIIVPSLYTFYEDKERWLRYATANLKEAKIYGKEVLPFLWFEYHNSSDKAGEEIETEFWELQLKTCLELTGNVVIWGGWQDEFDVNARWYQSVLKIQNKI